MTRKTIAPRQLRAPEPQRYAIGSDVETMIPEYTALLEIRTAERDRLLDVVERLERIVPPGYMEHEGQTVLYQARALLVEMGRRAPSPFAPWVDRKPRT